MFSNSVRLASKVPLYYNCYKPLLSLISMASTMLMRDSQRANQAVESIKVLLSVVQDLEFSGSFLKIVFKILLTQRLHSESKKCSDTLTIAC